MAEPNRVMCMECADKEVEYSRNKRLKNLQSTRDKDLKKYYALKEQGVCVYCKKNPAIAGKTKCAKCLAKVKNRRNSKKCDLERSERIAYGLCYICGKEKVMPGKGVCEKCYKVRCESISKIMYMHSNQYWADNNKLIFIKK